MLGGLLGMLLRDDEADIEDDRRRYNPPECPRILGGSSCNTIAVTYILPAVKKGAPDDGWSDPGAEEK